MKKLEFIYTVEGGDIIEHKLLDVKLDSYGKKEYRCLFLGRVPFVIYEGTMKVFEDCKEAQRWLDRRSKQYGYSSY